MEHALRIETTGLGPSLSRSTNLESSLSGLANLGTLVSDLSYDF